MRFSGKQKKNDGACFSGWRDRSRKGKGKRGKREKGLGRERNRFFLRTFPPPLVLTNDGGIAAILNLAKSRGRASTNQTFFAGELSPLLPFFAPVQPSM